MQDIRWCTEERFFVSSSSLYKTIEFCPKNFFSLHQIAPFTLVPTGFPRQEFEKAVRLQTILNELMHWVAHDTDFLYETLASTIKGDEFTANLFQIYETILSENDQQVSDLSVYLLLLLLGRTCLICYCHANDKIRVDKSHCTRTLVNKIYLSEFHNFFFLLVRKILSKFYAFHHSYLFNPSSTNQAHI